MVVGPLILLAVTVMMDLMQYMLEIVLIIITKDVVDILQDKF